MCSRLYKTRRLSEHTASNRPTTLGPVTILPRTAGLVVAKHLHDLWPLFTHAVSHGVRRKHKVYLLNNISTELVIVRRWPFSCMVLAWFSIALRPRKPEGSLGRIAQDGHLDSHTAPEPCQQEATSTINKESWSVHRTCSRRLGV